MKKRNTVLIVDDMEVNRAILCGLFEGKYELLEAENGVRALELLRRRGGEIAVVLLDIVMPEKDGYEVLQEMQQTGMLKTTPVVVITSENSAESELLAFDYGASDIVTKPFEPHLVKRRVENIVELYRHKLHLEDLVEEQAARLRKSNEVLTDALSTVIEYRSLESGQHILRIRMFTKVLSEEIARRYPEYQLNAAKIDVIARASAMHDIGKIAIPDSILNKPGRLTEAEFAVMKTHAVKGAEILAGLGQMEDREFLQYAYNICRYHHERWDGRGYPDGLKGENIPICAQAVGIADAYDALTTDRVYKAAYSHEKAAAMILNGECGTFSSALLECFKNVQEKFGALMREYADGRKPKTDQFLPHTAKHGIEDTADEAQFAKMKYQTLLKYIDATVLEIDFDAARYDMAYSPTSDFDVLRGDATLEEATQSFFQSSVHPDDQQMLERCRPACLKKLFQDGAMRASQRYRVFSREMGAYRWYEATVLRVNTENPKQCKALVVWRRLARQRSGAAEDAAAQELYAVLRDNCHVIFANNLTNDTYTIFRSFESGYDLRDYPLSYAAAIEKEAQEMIHPEDRQQFLGEYDREKLRAYFETHASKLLRYRRKCADRKYHWIYALCIRDKGALNGDVLFYNLIMDADLSLSSLAAGTGYEKALRPLLTTAAGGGDLETLSNRIPGGMFCCLDDEGFTLLQVNDGFLELSGYTREEIWRDFQNSFYAMIDPRDRVDVIAEMRRQLVRGMSKELQYRLLRKDGSFLWVLDKGNLICLEDGRRLFCCILIDITQSKQTQEKLRLALERHEIVMDQTSAIVLEWDIREDRFSYSTNWEKKFGYAPLEEHVSTRIRTDSHIHPEDHDAFLALLDAIKAGEMYAEADFRLKTTAVSFIWCRLRLTAQHDEANQPVKAVGVILDIDSEKKQMQKLLEVARRDSLTNLYNKGTAQKLIEERLEGQEAQCCALLIVDIDDFKRINDTKGHLFGDAFLIEVARRIQKQFRFLDLVGRIGGDEFIVYMQDVASIEAVQKRAEQILAAFQGIKLEEELQDCISCSIGYALYPMHGKSYKELYKRADVALYRAKQQGKNRAVVYDGIEEMPKNISSVVNEKIDSDSDSKALHDKLVEYVFKVLYQSEDVEAALHVILTVIGRQFDVSRVYIFENSEDDFYCSNTFEWCNEGVAPQIDRLQALPFDSLREDYRKNFDEKGILYCRDVSALPRQQYDMLRTQGVKSLLQCAIYDNGKFKGFVGFDECRVNRFWTQEQVDALTFISEVLSTFLLKKRAQDRSLQNMQAMEVMLDSQNSWIYVIDPDTYELLYINRKTRELVPASKVGMCCYAAYFKRSEPCAECPLRGLGEGRKSCTMEIYNPALRVWSMADASRIVWKERDAIMLCCREITKYKAALEDSK